MPFVRPTIAKLISRAKADIETRLPGSDANIRRSVEAVLARMSSGGTHGLHGHLVWLSKQLMPDTAEEELMVRWADIWGVHKAPAVAAAGSLTITGVNTTVCPIDTFFQDADGLEYTTDAAVTITGGSATPAVTAVVAGLDSNQVVGASLSLVTPITDIDTVGTVSGSGLIGGLDVETAASLLAQLLLRIQSPPKAGGPNDYINWSLEVSGVTRAWQYANLDGLGTVGVRFVMDDKAGTIIPDSSEVAIVQAYLDARAPVTADVNVYAPVALALDITSQIAPNTAAIQTAAEAEIAAYLLREGEPNVTLLLSQINEAISIAPGETDHVLTVPAANVVHTNGQIPVVGTYIWSAIP